MPQQHTVQESDDLSSQQHDEESIYDTPFARDQYKSTLRRFAGRLGLDFAVAIFRTLTQHIDVALEDVVGATMSSTGFVTFWISPV